MKAPLVRTREEFHAIVRFGETRESQILKFKAEYQTKNREHRRELRKDVVAMANTWGGCILVGISEDSTAPAKPAANVFSIDAVSLQHWVAEVLKQDVFPLVRFEQAVFEVADKVGTLGNILAINVFPHVDGIGCFADDENRMTFPYRDDFGVKTYSPTEAIKRMLPKVRRAQLLFHRHGELNKEMRISSPVIEIRQENNQERMMRLQEEGIDLFQAPGSLLAFKRSPHRDLAIPIPNCQAFIRDMTDSAVGILVRGFIVNVPFGVVREVWPTADGYLAVALECEITIDLRVGSRAAYLRFASGS